MIRAGHLTAALEGGELTWSEVDRSVERTVATRLRFEEVLSAPVPERSVLACPAHRALAREAAAKSVVLLRNEPVGGLPVLPLDADTVRTVAVIGRLGSEVNLGDGGSSDVWAPEVVTVVDGLRGRVARCHRHRGRRVRCRPGRRLGRGVRRGAGRGGVHPRRRG